MEDPVSSLKQKVEKLISRYEYLKAENASLKETVSRYEHKIEIRDNKIAELEKKLNNLQLKEAFLGTSPDKAKAGKKVASLIKEIDSCISMLSE